MGEQPGPMETGEFQATVLGALEGLRADVKETQESLEEVQAGVQKLDKDTAVMKAGIDGRLDTLEGRGDEDRKKRDTQIEGVHKRLDGIADAQARQRGELDSHIQDGNRHAGEAPGGGGKAKDLALGGGAVGGIVLLVEAAKAIFGG